MVGRGVLVMKRTNAVLEPVPRTRQRLTSFGVIAVALSLMGCTEPPAPPPESSIVVQNTAGRTYVLVDFGGRAAWTIAPRTTALVTTVWAPDSVVLTVQTVPPACEVIAEVDIGARPQRLVAFVDPGGRASISEREPNVDVASLPTASRTQWCLAPSLPSEPVR
jgi:hypothetical protein